MLIVPPDIEIVEYPKLTLWVDEDGIVCSFSKKEGQRTLEETKIMAEDFKKRIGNRKVCVLKDVTYSSATTREIRNFEAEELPKVIKALALISDSALGKMWANLFLSLTNQPYPVKMFNSETEAKQWLKQYL